MIFIVFYIIRIIIMDLGYAILVGLYYIEQFNQSDILNEDKKYIFITLYILDFFISLFLFSLFYQYSKKASEAEMRMNHYYLMSMKEEILS
jgi:hypothetical protein